MKVKIRKIYQQAIIPSYSKIGDAGMDLSAISIFVESNYIEYGTGLAIEIPDGYVGLIFPRSSISNKTLILSNSVGVIDSGYRGEIKFRFKRTNDSILESSTYQIGDRIGQLIIIPFPKIELEETNELSDTQRGTTGFGSTGN